MKKPARPRSRSTSGGSRACSAPLRSSIPGPSGSSAPPGPGLEGTITDAATLPLRSRQAAQPAGNAHASEPVYPVLPRRTMRPSTVMPVQRAPGLRRPRAVARSGRRLALRSPTARPRCGSPAPQGPGHGRSASAAPQKTAPGRVAGGARPPPRRGRGHRGPDLRRHLPRRFRFHVHTLQRRPLGPPSYPRPHRHRVAGGAHGAGPCVWRRDHAAPDPGPAAASGAADHAGIGRRHHEGDQPGRRHIQAEGVTSTDPTTGQGTAVGSGVILDAKGLILTNTHVVSGNPSKLTVTSRMMDLQRFGVWRRHAHRPRDRQGRCAPAHRADGYLPPSRLASRPSPSAARCEFTFRDQRDRPALGRTSTRPRRCRS